MPMHFNHSFDETFIFRRKPLETFTISLSERANPSASIKELFYEPIHIAVLRLSPDRVKLGVYAHPQLKIHLDGFVDDAWQERMKNEPV